MAKVKIEARYKRVVRHEGEELTFTPGQKPVEVDQNVIDDSPFMKHYLDSGDLVVVGKRTKTVASKATADEEKTIIAAAHEEAAQIVAAAHEEAARIVNDAEEKAADAAIKAANAVKE